MSRPARKEIYQSQKWVFTCWDLSKATEWAEWPNGPVTFIRWGLEQAPTTGNWHMQGYVEVDKKKTKVGMIRKVMKHNMFMEARKGSLEDNFIYTGKDEDVYEWGTPMLDSVQGKRTDLIDVRKFAKEFGMRAVLEEDHPEKGGAMFGNQAIKHAQSYLSYCEEKRTWKPTVIWYWGESGSGKSRDARYILDGIDTYVKNDGTKWWDGYDGHEAIILDDFRDRWWPIEYMLCLLDRYEARKENKNGHRQLRPRYIVITTIKPPKDHYRSGEEEPEKQLLRRIDLTIEMKCEPEKDNDNF